MKSDECGPRIIGGNICSLSPYSLFPLKQKKYFFPFTHKILSRTVCFFITPAPILLPKSSPIRKYNWSLKWLWNNLFWRWRVPRQDKLSTKCTPMNLTCHFYCCCLPTTKVYFTPMPKVATIVGTSTGISGWSTTNSVSGSTCLEQKRRGKCESSRGLGCCVTNF